MEKELNEDVQTKLVNLEIEAKQTRKKRASYILIIVALTGLFYWGYVYSGNGIFALLAVFAGLLGGMYIAFSAIPTLFQPLCHEDFAFKKIAKAIELLKKSKSSTLVFEEASHYIRSAYEELENVDLDELEWYENINIIFKQFTNNLRLLVPEVAQGKISAEDLEKVALALSSRDVIKLEDAFAKLPLNEEKTKLSNVERLTNFFNTHRILTNTLFVVIVIFSCAFFYYIVTVYGGISKDFAFGGIVAIFVGALTIYFTRRKG